MKSKLKVLFIIVLFFFMICVVGVLYAKNWYDGAIYDSNLGEGKVFDITVTEGETFMTVAKRMEQVGLIKSQNAVKLYLQLKSIEPNIKVGTYKIPSDKNVPEIIAILEAGVFKPGIRITIKEGLRAFEIAELLQENLGNDSRFVKADFDYIVKNPDNYEFSPKVQSFLDTYKPAGKPLEGFLYPDTYEFDPEWTAVQVADKILVSFVEKVEDNIDLEALALALEQNNITNFYDALILGSIVEREASGKDDKKEISGVFHNRLANDISLGADSTISYITGQTSENLNTNLDSPYNSYKNLGLPPTPIANPGIDAILSAFYPNNTEYLFFFHDDEGNTYYSKTDAEHGSKVCEIRGC